jgi:hypothetical protein
VRFEAWSFLVQMGNRDDEYMTPRPAGFQFGANSIFSWKIGFTPFSVAVTVVESNLYSNLKGCAP